jgi:CheY-like chemotaxis protein
MTNRVALPEHQRPLRIIVVEDEALLAMDIEQIVSEVGHLVVAEASSFEAVEMLDQSIQPDVAFVDINLGGGLNGLDVAAHILLRWKSTTVVFLTANPKKIPENFVGASGVIAKPFTRLGLSSAMRYLEEGVRHPPPDLPVPSSFSPSPKTAAVWNLRAPPHVV